MCVSFPFRYEKIVPTEVKDLVIAFDLESAVMQLSKFSVDNNMVCHIKRADQIEWETYIAKEHQRARSSSLWSRQQHCLRKVQACSSRSPWGLTYNGNSGQIFVEESRNSLKGQVLKIDCKKNQVFSLDQAFSVISDCGETKTAHINEDFVISQFYTNEDL